MKKKTIISLCLIAVVCFACFAPALALQDNRITSCAIVTFSSGMPKVAGTTNKYNPYAIASVGLPEQISVGFTLYKVVNGTEIYITSDSDGGHGNFFEAEAVVTLSKGTYKLYAYYRGETNHDGSVKTYIIK